MDHPEVAATEEHQLIWHKTMAVLEALSWNPYRLSSTAFNLKNYKALKSRLSDRRVIAQETHARVVASLELKYLSFFWNTMWVLLLKEHNSDFVLQSCIHFFYCCLKFI